MTFAAASTATGNPIPSIAGVNVAPAFKVDYKTVRDSLEREFPLHDVVRVWRAPYSGTVSVMSHVEKHSSEGDGVSLSMQFNSDVLWKDTLLQSGSVTLPAITRSVKPGDVFVFRVGARYSGIGDDVIWDPEITYTSIKTDKYAGEDLKKYRSSEDYIAVHIQQLPFRKLL